MGERLREPNDSEIGALTVIPLSRDAESSGLAAVIG
jgi:hypothetical protein